MKISYVFAVNNPGLQNGRNTLLFQVQNENCTPGGKLYSIRVVHVFPNTIQQEHNKYSSLNNIKNCRHLLHNTPSSECTLYLLIEVVTIVLSWNQDLSHIQSMQFFNIATSSVIYFYIYLSKWNLFLGNTMLICIANQRCSHSYYISE